LLKSMFTDEVNFITWYFFFMFLQREHQMLRYYAQQSAADSLSFVKFTKQGDYKTVCFSHSIHFTQNTLYRIQYSD
jgi:hypothetical protein